VRKIVLWLFAAAALAAPIAALSLRARDARTAARALSDAEALLEPPIESVAQLETADLVRAQSLLESVTHTAGDACRVRRARSLWHVAQGYRDLSRGEQALASHEADTAAQLEPGSTDAALLLATVALRRGDRVQADLRLADLSRADEGSMRRTLAARAALLRLGLLLDGSRTDEALATAEALDRAHPHVASVTNLLGLARDAAGDRRGAEDAFTLATHLDAHDATPWINLARIARLESRFTDARTDLERALGIAPDSNEAWLAYGVVLSELHDEGARPALVRASQLAPDDSAPWSAQGNLDLADGNLAGAVESYRNALARDPDDATAHSNLGVALARRGERDAAITAFENATRHAPQLGEAWNGLGATRLAAGDAQNAIGPLQQASVLLPRDPNPLLNLGRAYESLARLDDAVRAFREALARAPGNEVAVEHLMRLLPPNARARELARSPVLARR
jgi:tetratricopeptide (TPR) repeat protein